MLLILFISYLRIGQLYLHENFYLSNFGISTIIVLKLRVDVEIKSMTHKNKTLKDI